MGPWGMVPLWFPPLGSETRCLLICRPAGPMQAGGVRSGFRGAQWLHGVLRGSAWTVWAMCEFFGYLDGGWAGVHGQGWQSLG
jgi:hypothetical protein